MIDTHAHIYLPEFEGDLDQVIDRAKEEGIDAILMPNIDGGSFESMARLAERYPGYCVPMAGLHPCYVKEGYQKDLDRVRKELLSGNYVAVGEIGTDLYWDKTWWEEQKDAFLQQMEWSDELKLPSVIHCRESIAETITLIRSLKRKTLRGVFHCFTGTLEQAYEVIDLGFMLGIGGVATFKNGGISDVVAKVPLESLVLETDSPYLAPVPFRGKRNEPSYIRLVAEKVASLRQMDLPSVIEATASNSRRLFGL